MTTQLEYKTKIHSTASLQKIFKAQELIATSRVAKSRDYALASEPYAQTIYTAVKAISEHTKLDHPIIKQKILPKGVAPTTAILVIAADRGMAGAYTVQILREVNLLAEKIKQENPKREIAYFVSGARAASNFRFRGVEMLKNWHGGSDAPPASLAKDITDSITEVFLDKQSSIDEVIVVYTHFVNMVVQKVITKKILPLKAGNLGKNSLIGEVSEASGVFPLYEFEPSVDKVLDVLLKGHFSASVHNVLLDAAASETASRQTAMHAASENASDLIKDLTTKANQARQAAITTELNEIVASSDALSKKNKS